MEKEAQIVVRLTKPSLQKTPTLYRSYRRSCGAESVQHIMRKRKQESNGSENSTKRTLIENSDHIPIRVRCGKEKLDLCNFRIRIRVCQVKSRIEKKQNS